MADNKTPQEKNIQQQPKPDQEKMSIPPDIIKEMDEIMRRIRLLEERYSGIRKKSQFTEQNMLKDTKDIFEEINLLNSSLSDIKGEVSEINEKIQKLSEEMHESVKKTEFNVLAKYLDFWQPLNFLTREEAKKLINEQKK